jgi:hypothetical protein
MRRRNKGGKKGKAQSPGLDSQEDPVSKGHESASVVRDGLVIRRKDSEV